MLISSPTILKGAYRGISVRKSELDAFVPITHVINAQDLEIREKELAKIRHGASGNSHSAKRDTECCRAHPPNEYRHEHENCVSNMTKYPCVG